jgi:hypothetical protein
MSDLSQRLREHISPRYIAELVSADLILASAERIEALERENAELREALKPFALFYDQRHQKYVKRGGSFAAFTDSHHAFDISASDPALPLGVWRSAYSAALMDAEERKE